MMNDRASHAYRIGYAEGEQGLPITRDYVPGTFAWFDYWDGRAAGANDVWWGYVRRGYRT